jgi:hypothetical protein
MRRRTFLLSTTAALCGAIGWRFASSSDESAIAKVLHKKLHYLRLDEAGVRRYAADIAGLGIVSSLRLHVIDAADGLYLHHTLNPDNALGRALRHGEDRVVTQYLISSDFFKNGADKNRTVNYLGYYDPMVACNNPFARPVDAATATQPTGT